MTRRTSETGAFFAPRMRTPRGPSRTLWSLHRIVSTSDVPSSLVGTPESESEYPPELLSSITFLADGDGELTCESKDLNIALPVRARRALARERLSSYREPASRNPQAAHKRLVRDSCVRALFRLLPIRAPRQAVLRTSSWLAPSVTNRSCDLPALKARNASNRCLPPNQTACTRTSRVPGSLRRFRDVDTPRRLRLRAVIPGDRTLHGARDRFGGSSCNTRLVLLVSRPYLRVTGVGVFFPRC